MDLQPETRLHTTNKVVKIIVLILFIPLPPNVCIKEPTERNEQQFDVDKLNLQTLEQTKQTKATLPEVLESKGRLIELPRELVDNLKLQQGNFLLSSLEETLHGVFGQFTASGFTLHGQHQRHTRLQVLEVHILHLNDSTSAHKCVSVHEKRKVQIC